MLEKDLLLLFFFDFDFDLGLLLVADLAPAQRGHRPVLALVLASRQRRGRRAAAADAILGRTGVSGIVEAAEVAEAAVAGLAVGTAAPLLRVPGVELLRIHHHWHATMHHRHALELLLRDHHHDVVPLVVVEVLHRRVHEGELLVLLLVVLEVGAPLATEAERRFFGALAAGLLLAVVLGKADLFPVMRDSRE